MSDDKVWNWFTKIIGTLGARNRIDPARSVRDASGHFPGPAARGSRGSGA